MHFCVFVLFRDSPRSAEAPVIWDGKTKYLLIVYFLINLSAEKLSKSVSVCRRYKKANAGHFWNTAVYSPWAGGEIGAI